MKVWRFVKDLVSGVEEWVKIMVFLWRGIFYGYKKVFEVEFELRGRNVSSVEASFLMSVNVLDSEMDDRVSIFGR